MTLRMLLRDIARRLKAAVVPALIALAVFVALFLLCQVLMGADDRLVGTPLFAFPLAVLLFCPLYQAKLPDFRTQSVTGSTRTSAYWANVLAALLLGAVFAAVAIALALFYRMMWVVCSGKAIWRENYLLQSVDVLRNFLTCAAMTSFLILLTRLVCDTVAFGRSAVGICGLISVIVIPLIVLFIVYSVEHDLDFGSADVLMLGYFAGCSLLLAGADRLLTRGDYIK